MVYIVDDGEDYQYLLQQVFSRYLSRYSVRFFTDGEQLHQHLLTGKELPQLILLDLDMPILDGFQTLRLLKQHTHWKRIPTVIMSNSLSSENIQACYDAFANSFLVKASDFEQLKQQIEAICQYWLELNQTFIANR
ncbi:response regulator [Spirosoma taeanense]|uniref:Response regulator n=1 Tax=Spirosoma taeanense TaxID=2735870 RepID=A0A6M5Y575_9BACT|nr:response regulator [Spirosoma taeanense]QJW89647.1 response regulator [Spirosoma taeanense]